LPLRHAEEDDGRHAQVPEPAALLRRAIDRALRDARHRLDRLLDPAPGHDEERLHELGRVDARLAHQAAERLIAAEPAGAVGGEAAHDGACIKASERGLWKPLGATSAGARWERARAEPQAVSPPPPPPEGTRRPRSPPPRAGSRPG